ISCPPSLTIHHGVVRLLNPIPTVVAVHGVVAARDRRDLPVGLAGAVFAHLLLERRQVFRALRGWGIASVEKDVHEDVSHALLAGHPEQRVQMLLGGMNAAVTQETQQVQPMRASVLHQFEQKRMLEELPAQDGSINARNLLIDDSASADIEVP